MNRARLGNHRESNRNSSYSLQWIGFPGTIQTGKPHISWENPWTGEDFPNKTINPSTYTSMIRGDFLVNPSPVSVIPTSTLWFSIDMGFQPGLARKKSWKLGDSQRSNIGDARKMALFFPPEMWLKMWDFPGI